MVKSGSLILGQYQGTLTSKGRLAFPKKLRSRLGDKVIITRGYDGCLLAMRLEQWKSLVKQLGGNSFILEASRETSRFLLGNAAEVELDSQGRFILPQHLRRYAKISDKVVFLGLYRYVEIWDLANWEKYQHYLSQNIKHISERLAHGAKSA